MVKKTKEKEQVNIKRLIGPEGFKDMGFTHLLFNLFAQGCSHIRFEYSGGGDSGCIDCVTAFKLEDVKVDPDENLYEVVDDPTPLELEEELQNHIESVITDKILEKADDWWNNDGGGGTLWIDCRDASYYGDHYVNITTTEDSVLSGKMGDSV